MGKFQSKHAAAACKRRESPEGKPRRSQGARRPPGRMRRAPSLGRALPRALGGQFRGVRVCEWPQRRGRDRTARRRQRRRGTSRTGQAGKRPDGGAGSRNRGPPRAGRCALAVPLYHGEMQKP
ncbi:hypothetical protein U0070_011089 [Myodes glareolus]|uniref:Uncharacterized protein n=1 Tax=Myodes glareolus TaxID=447135 RepID=A0AAW0IES8_MYOGA